MKKTDTLGMAQRGGSVVSEVRFGARVYSPLAPERGADYVIALDDREGLRNAYRLRDDGRPVNVPPELHEQLGDPRARNMAALGRLSPSLDVDAELWHEAIRRCMPPRSVEVNLAAFEAGRAFRE